MRSISIKVMAAGLMACGLFACSTPNLAELPVRTTPQTEEPHSEAADGAPLRGTAVAVEMAPVQ